MKKKVLILGGTGYIGSALYQHLTKHVGMRPFKTIHKPNIDGQGTISYIESGGYEVDTIDLEWFGNFVNSENLKSSFLHLPSFYANYDAVVMLAAHSSVPMANLSDPHATVKNNVSDFIRILHAIPNGVKFIYAGSASVYNGLAGNSKEYAVLPPPFNIYDATKQHIDEYAALSDVEYYGLRLATVNGASPNLRTDIMINGMVEQLRKTKTIELFNPRIRRPILDIHDLCRAIRYIISSDKDQRGLYNLASFNSTAAEIAMEVAIQYKSGSSVKIIDAPQTNIAPYNFAVDTTKFQRAFDFTFFGSVKSIVEGLTADNGIIQNRATRNVAIDNV